MERDHQSRRPTADPSLTQAKRDIILTVVVVTLVVAIVVSIDLFELLYRATRSHEHWELDDLIIGAVVLLLAIGWLVYRRWAAAKDEVARRAATEQDLRDRCDELDFLVSAAPGVFYVREPDTDGALRFVSSNVVRQLGYEPEALSHKAGIWSNLIHADDRARALAHFSALPENHYEPCEYRLADSAGDYRTIRDVAELFRDGKGRPLRVIGFWQDVSADKAVRENLRAAKSAAERANAAKSRFLAAASHDLRQPLQAIRLLHAILSDDLVDSRQESVVRDMGQAIKVMGDLLDSVLDISRLEAGVVTPEIENFGADVVLSHLASTFHTAAEEQGIELRVVPSSVAIRSDPALLERILRNLLSNAIGRSQGHKVLVGCRRSGDGLRFEVHDDGIGIPPDQIEEIFEEYHQLDNPARSRDRGLGLGLSIVRRLARLLGHRVEVRSIEGQGSTFSVAVPMARAVEQQAGFLPAMEPELLDLTGRAVLVVDDDLLVLNATKQLLASWGAEVIEACSAEAAFQAAAQSSVPPDLIVADYRLPAGENSCALIERLRDHYGTIIPAVHITGDTSPATIRKISGLPDSALAHKPVDPTELGSLIHGLMPDRACQN
ncbi:MAG: ATP-binding protein [Alphaproteobacteria bacterium]|nr:ATP-binding protein [Alphaproteobacteria bacterium]